MLLVEAAGVSHVIRAETGAPIQRGQATIELMREPGAPEGEFVAAVQSRVQDTAPVECPTRLPLRPSWRPRTASCR
ncbi:MAG: hypothetical protein ACLQU1_24530 [Bryobacteraceae bacterium]